jgi:hypothetical protein
MMENSNSIDVNHQTESKMVRKINIVKRTAFWVLLCFSLSISGLKAQDLLWKANLGGTSDNYPAFSAIDSQNNIYIIGTFNGTCGNQVPLLVTKGANDVFLAKYDSNGTLLWNKQIGSSLVDIATGLVVSSDDEYIYTTGVFQNTAYADNLSINSTGSYDGFLAKYKKNGDLVWIKDIANGSGVTVQRPTGVKMDKNNHLVIGGLFFSEIKLGNDINNIQFTTSQPLGMFIAQFDTSGNILNAKKFESSNSSSRLYTFDVDTSGYYLSGFYKGNIVTDLGTKTSNNNSSDIYVYKVDYNLNGKWIVQVSGAGDDQLYSCSVDNKGFFYFGGPFASNSLVVDSTSSGIPSQKIAYNTTSNGNYDIFFAKYSSSGILQWFNTAGSTGNDYLYRALYKNGNFIVAGQYGGTLTFNNQTITTKGGGDAFAIVHDNNDNLKYLIPIGGSGSDIGETAVVDNNGNFVVIGDYTSPKIYFGNNKDSLTNSNPGTKDMFVAKYDKASLKKVITPVACAGTSTGIIDITPMGTVVAPLTYAWSKRENPAFTASTEDLNGVSAGTYRVTFTDALGYTKTDSVTLTDPAPLAVNLANKTNATCFNDINGTIDITPSGGTLPYSYVWSASSGSGLNVTSQDQAAVSAGNYSVTVNDNNGCSISLTNIAISQPAKIQFTGTTFVDIGVSPPTPGSVNLSVTGGTPGYSYAWQGPSGYTASTQDISNLTNPGSYTVTVTDTKNCTGDTSIQVIDGLMLAYIQAKNDVSCHGDHNGNATAAAYNAIGALSYTWDDALSTTGSTVSNLLPGTYHVTVTDAGRPVGNNQSTATVIIGEPVLLAVTSINKTDISCYDKPGDGTIDAVIAGGTIPYTYHWTKDVVDFATTEDLNSLSEGSYALTVTDAHGCTATGSGNIVRPLPLSLTGSVKNVTCEGSKDDAAITLDTPTGGWPTYTYAWSNGLTSQNISLLSTGGYTVTVTDSRNCKATLTKYIDYESPISITFNVNDVLCKGAPTGNAHTLISGGHAPLTYQWSNGTTNSNITGVTAGSYTVTVTDNKLCTKIKSVVIGEPALALDIIKTDSINVTCHGGSNGSINVSATGGTPTYRYGWSDSKGTLGTLVSNLTAGDYSVTVTDNNSCYATKTYHVAEPDAIVLTERLSSHTDLLCNGAATGVIEVQATGGTGAYQYAVDNNSWVSSPVFTGLSGKAYSFKVQDAANCIDSMSQKVTIAEPAAISLGTLTKTDGCHGLGNGAISISATGGTGAFNYTLKLNGALSGNTSGTSTGSFTNVTPSAGYTIEVTDANNCGPVVSNSTDIIDPQEIIPGTVAHTNVSCYGRNDGNISLSATGGTSPFVYNLKINGIAASDSTGKFTGIFTNVAPGIKYTIGITDANLCSAMAIDSIDILEPNAITITKDSVQKATSNSPWNGSRIVMATGGTGALSYTLNGLSQDNGLFSGLAPGAYTITVTDQNNCGPVNSSDLIVSDATGIPGLKQDNLKIYPNPIHDKVTLDFGDGLTETLQIEVIAVNGKSFYKVNVNVSTDGKVNLSLGSLARGMYLLKINNQVVKDKLILQ